MVDKYMDFIRVKSTNTVYPGTFQKAYWKILAKGRRAYVRLGMKEYVCSIKDGEYDNTDSSEVGVIGYNDQCDGYKVMLHMTWVLFSYK